MLGERWIACLLHDNDVLGDEREYRLHYTHFDAPSRLLKSDLNGE